LDGSASAPGYNEALCKLKPKKGISREQKKIVKAVAKELGKIQIGFELSPYDLSKAKIDVVYNKDRTQVNKVMVTIDGKYMKLSKKDYDVVIKDDKVTITGKGNFTGVVVFG